MRWAFIVHRACSCCVLLCPLAPSLTRPRSFATAVPQVRHWVRRVPVESDRVRPGKVRERELLLCAACPFISSKYASSRLLTIRMGAVLLRNMSVHSRPKRASTHKLTPPSTPDRYLPHFIAPSVAVNARFSLPVHELQLPVGFPLLLCTLFYTRERCLLSRYA